MFIAVLGLQTAPSRRSLSAGAATAAAAGGNKVHLDCSGLPGRAIVLCRG